MRGSSMKTSKVWLLSLGLVPLLAGTAITAQAQQQAPQWVETAGSGPEQLFAEKCGMCHRVQGMGTTLLQRRYDPELALLENRRDLAPEFVRTVVRSGFNNMFPISRGEVSDAQLERIISHLTQEKAE